MFQVITGAGHHVFADRPERFNRFVNEACALSDSDSSTSTIKSDADEEDSQTQVENEDNDNTTTETTIKVDTKSFVKTST